MLAFFFAGRLSLTEAQLLDGQKLDRDGVRRALALTMWELDAAQQFDKSTVEAVLKGVAERLERKLRDIARLFYVVLTGSPTSVPLFDAAELLGRDICRERLRGALNTLGAPSANEQKAWRAAPPPAVPV